MKKTVLIVVLVLVVVSGGLLLKKRKQAVADEPVAAPVLHTVRGVVPKIREVVELLPVLARLESRNLGNIASKLTAQVVEVAVHEAQEVKEGEVLVRLDSRDIKATLEAGQVRLQAAQSRLDYSRTLYERNQALFAAGGLSREKLQESGVAMAAARADVADVDATIRSTIAQLDYGLIRAPFKGRVGSIAIRPGELVSPGRVILTLNSVEQKLTFTFAPGTAIREGQVVRLHSTPIGFISTIYTEAKGGLWVAEINLDHDLATPSGTSLTVEVVMGRGTGCAVPVQALLHRSDGVSVMEYRDNHFLEKKVVVQVLGREYAQILPCGTAPVAVASESKLVVLPSYGQVNLITGASHE